MSTRKRALPSTSSGQPSLLKRPRTARTNQTWRPSGSDLVPGRWYTEQVVRRVVREELERSKNSHLAEYCQSCMGNAFEEIMQQISSVKNDVQKLTETVEPANNHSSHLGRVDARSTGINDVRNLRLQFQTKPSDPLFTGRKLRGDGGACISVVLIDANTGDVVTSGLESSLKLDVVVLEGDFNKDDEDDWSHEEFENFMVKERQQKGLLLTGDLQVMLNGGVGELGELIFADNSSWNRSKKFRIGLTVALGYCGNTRIREAKTNAFRVKEQRGESSKKHDIPAFDDEIWRLKKIAKDGKYHRKLSEAGIHKVGDFLLQLVTDPMKLKEILGMSSNLTNWDTLENHARGCKINWKLYLYYTDGTRKHGAVFDTDHQLIGLIKDRVYCTTDQLSADDLEHGDTLVKMALDNKNDVMEFNGETFSPSMQKKSLSSIPCQVFEGQIENLTPVESNFAPRILAAPGGLEAPLANVGLTAEASKKHDIPAFGDEIWRLKMIAKDGKYHQKLSEAGIHKVGDFLLQLLTDPMKLKEILGISSNSTKWDTLENHARSCKINWKLYLYCTDGTRKHGAVFNTDHQLIGLIKDRVYCATDRLSADDLEHGDAIVKKALDNKNDVREFNGETFSPSLQKKSSSSIPCQVLEEQVENQGPVQSNFAPRIWAAPGGSEAPLANVGLTAEEHDGATALALLVRLQNTNSGNAMKLSIDESVHLAAQKPISTDSVNVLIPQGDIHSSRQMDYMVNENGPPSEPPLDPISSFQHSSTLPHPQGNHVVEGFQSIDSDDILGDRCPDDLASSEFCLNLQVSSVTPVIHKRKKKKGKVEKSISGEEDREFAEREGKREENDRERNKKKNKKEEERRGAISMDVSSSRLNCVMQSLIFWLATNRIRVLSMETFGSGLLIRFEDTLFK